MNRNKDLNNIRDEDRYYSTTGTILFLFEADYKNYIVITR